MASIFVTMGSPGSSDRLINIGTGREENISAYIHTWQHGNSLHDDGILWRCGALSLLQVSVSRYQQGAHNDGSCWKMFKPNM